MAGTIIQTAVVNNKGRIRPNNEDNFYLDGTFLHRGNVNDGAFIAGNSKNEYQLYAVCDGMGGSECGEEASLYAVSALAQKKDSLPGLTDKAALTEMLRDVSGHLYDEASSHGIRSGTTIAMALVEGNQIHIANVGDSRVYGFRDRTLTQISVDHSRVQRMVAMGMITPEQARTDPDRHKINQYLGMPKEVPIAPFITSAVPMRKNDIYLLCSDGLTDMVEDKQIEAILREGKDAGETAKTLAKTALSNGGRDNVTVMILKVQQVDETRKRAVLNKKQSSKPILTIAQVITGCALLASAADTLYYLFNH